MEYFVRILENEEVDDGFELIYRVFMQCLAPIYSWEGVQTFCKGFTNNKHFRNKFRTGQEWMYGAFEEEELIGVVSISKQFHISCVFVDPMYQHRGIGKMLFAAVLGDAQKGLVEKINLNASPQGVGFYEKLGFYATKQEQNVQGIIFTPMELILKQATCLH